MRQLVVKKKETGIFEFIKALPLAVLRDDTWKFSLPSQLIEEYEADDVYNVQRTICCVWSENIMQNNRLKKIYSIENMVLLLQDEALMETWGRLQSADYFYYMPENDGVHNNSPYHNPYKNPRTVFEYYNNIIPDFEVSLIKRCLTGLTHLSIVPVGNLY